jgi:hypothetical protein
MSLKQFFEQAEKLLQKMSKFDEIKTSFVVSASDGNKYNISSSFKDGMIIVSCSDIAGALSLQVSIREDSPVEVGVPLDIVLKLLKQMKALKSLL